MPLRSADTGEWPAVPDGAHLSDLATRRAWLGRIEIAYALPTNGWLWWPRASDGVVLACDGARLAFVPLDDPSQAQSVRMTLGTRQSVHEAWPGWWTAEPSADGGEPDAILVLRWKGLVSVRALHDAAARRLAEDLTSTLVAAFALQPEALETSLARRLLRTR